MIRKPNCKINLGLYVTGKRPDGYHLLDRLFVFPTDGVVIRIRDSETLSLKISGTYAEALSSTQDNIVLKAAQALAEEAGIRPEAEITLEKNLPVASGIGGGSADAAATLKALIRLWRLTVPEEKLYEIALKLGADVPSCLASKAVQVSGIGDILTPAPALPELYILLVNPNKPVSTPAVFKTRNPVFSEACPFTQDIPDFDDFIKELEARHNDLCEAACRLEPSVQSVLEALSADPLCRLARMSGSGGTCFGLFPNLKDATACREKIRSIHPEWWFLNTRAV